MEDTGVFTYRTSMKYNCILDKPDVGDPKLPFCHLPPPDFTYGCPSPKSNGTVKQALFDWYNSRPELNIKRKEPFGESYLLPYSKIKLNRMLDTTFGNKSKTSEDIQAVLCNAYYHKFIDTMKQRETKKKEKRREKSERVTESRQVIIRVSPKAEEDISPLWKMKKFSNAKAKVSTRRTKSPNLVAEPQSRNSQ